MTPRKLAGLILALCLSTALALADTPVDIVSESFIDTAPITSF
jgi:hypothetical protein